MNDSERNLITELLAIASPSGDESVMANWLTHWISQNFGSDLVVTRLRNCLVVTRGTPKVAVFAHIDTCGFMVGYGDPYELIPIGGPVFDSGARTRVVNGNSDNTGELLKTGENWTVQGLECVPGDRLVYASVPRFNGNALISPYLDNGGGIWAALQVLKNCEDVCICFTTGEETGGSGAIICAKYIYEKYEITKALISDITWDTNSVHCGNGVAISRRDRWVPSQAYVDQLIGFAHESGIAFQVEIESDGGSDGGGIERSGCPIDWAFVGAPSKRPHSSTEEVNLSDLDSMAQMLGYFVDRLSKVE